MYDIYRPHNIDDAWFFSLAYNYLNFGIEYDLMFDAGLSQGLTFFHKTGALLYGNFLNIVGWDYGKGQFLSFLLMAISGYFWFLTLDKLGFEFRSRIAFLLLFFYLEFSFSATNSIRYETLILALQSFTLYLFLKNKYFLVGLVSTIAFEVHPIAIMNLAYLFGLAASNHARKGFSHFFNPSNIKWQPIIHFSSGCFAGILYYFSLHPIPPTELYDFLFSNSIQGVGEYQDTKLGALGLYYFESKFYRHVPELIIVIASLFFYLFNRHYKDKLYILFWIVMLVILSFLRPIFTYAEIIYPAFLVLMVSSFQAIRRLNLLLVLFIFLMVPQYIGVYFINKDWDRNAYITEIKELVPNDGLPVIGSAISWHALKERKNFKSAVYPFIQRKNLGWNEFYFVEDFFIREKNEYAGAKAYLNENYNFSTIKTSNQTGKPVVLIKLTPKQEFPHLFLNDSRPSD